jgi:hypothetical protein
MGEILTAYNISVGKHEGKRLLRDLIIDEK